jgi:hypothetical protein
MIGGFGAGVVDELDDHPCLVVEVGQRRGGATKQRQREGDRDGAAPQAPGQGEASGCSHVHPRRSPAARA